jgi:hypothetical protein
MLTPIMKVLKCLISFSDGYVGRCFGLQYEGKLWLVPSWLQLPSEPSARPERIIRFDTFPHQALDGHEFDYENILLPISEAALRGELPPEIECRYHPLNLFVDSSDLRWP